MIDYYETKSQPITRLMVWEAYQKVKANKGSMGIDNMDWKRLESNRSAYIYKLWNRLTSGSYFPKPTKAVEIKKTGGGTRVLGIPTILDRIAQEVVRSQLDRYVEPFFHNHSYGYRKGFNAHQAVKQATENAFRFKWGQYLRIEGSISPEYPALKFFS